MNNFVKIGSHTELMRINSHSEYKNRAKDILSIIENAHFVPSTVKLELKGNGNSIIRNYFAKTSSQFAKLVSKAIASAYKEMPKNKDFHGSFSYKIVKNEREKRDVYFSLDFLSTEERYNKLFGKENIVISHITIDVTAKEVDDILDPIC